MVETALDRAHGAMETAPEDDTARLAFYHAIADTELFLLLKSEALGDDITPEIFDLEEGRFVMTFDLEERLAEFCDNPAPFAALPGRVIAGALAGQGIGIGVNLGVAPSAFLMPPEALGWLADTLAARPHLTKARPVAFDTPDGLPARLAEALAQRLEQLPGLARRACLARVTYEGGQQGHLLAVEGADARNQPAIAKAVSETLVFSGLEAGELDVTFLAADVHVPADLRRLAHGIDIPEGKPAPQPARTATAPGMDPARPPKLR